MMFGEDNPVNSQINMYILSRVTLGSARALLRHGYLTDFKVSPHPPLLPAVCG
jgi:hypothetical protein